jgi:hypothetical protein
MEIRVDLFSWQEQRRKLELFLSVTDVLGQGKPLSTLELVRINHGSVRQFASYPLSLRRHAVLILLDP